MEQLIQVVMQKTGLSAEIAKVAVETVLTHLKTVLPAPVAAQIDTFIKGGDVAGLGDVAMKSLGGFFGGKS